jgi:hypothetical protein
MATTTTNYGFDIPQSTDLVKDGATAIATLGQDIDTAMNTALGTKKAGMVLLNTTSFSGAVSHSFGSDAAPIFSSTYRNYKIILENLQCATGSTDVLMRLRSNTTDLTSANYNYQSIVGNGATITGGRASAQTSWALGSVSTTTSKSSCIVELLNPFETVFKNYKSDNPYHAQGTGPIAQYRVGYIDLTNSYNGFTIFTANTFSGTMSVYGYNQ